MTVIVYSRIGERAAKGHATRERYRCPAMQTGCGPPEGRIRPGCSRHSRASDPR